MSKSSETINVSISMTVEERDILDAARGKLSRNAYMLWKLFGNTKIKERRQ
jgi:hypothetical protein